MAKYVCSICGYVYDDKNEKIEFEKLPESWKCPLCGANKSDFVKQVEPNDIVKPIENNDTIEKEHNGENYVRLSNAQLNVLCTNLAKGCEKQYMDEEASLFKEIADYYLKNSEKSDKKSFDEIVSLLNKDSKDYANGFTVAKADNDRGALRILTWSDKVTKIVSSLIDRYKKEGSSFLQNSKIFVCEICGFIFIGDEAPEVCPICKVPRLKIHEVGRQ